LQRKFYTISLIKIHCIKLFKIKTKTLNIKVSKVVVSTFLLKALYVATFEAVKKWTLPIQNWGKVYGELSIMFEARLP
jgi:putative transposase